MDAELLSLFTTEEILERLAAKGANGMLHVFTASDSGNIFFRKGVIVAAGRGEAGSGDELREIISIREATCVWHADATPPMPPYKPIQVIVADLLRASSNGRPETPATRKSVPIPQFPPPGSTAGVTVAPFAVRNNNTASIGSTTAMPQIRVPPAAPGEVVRAGAPPGGKKSGATKSLPQAATTSGRVSQDSVLLSKHPLSLVSLDNPQQRIVINKVSSLIGRNPACDISIDHGSISRQHCLLQITDRGLHIKDLGTTNGTRVNGIALAEGYVSVGDKITMGHLVFVLERN
jgi:hypothetical protein